MILLLDNNEYRRHDIWLSLFIKKYVASEQLLREASYFTKPILTAYINPTVKELEGIKREDTICVVAKNNMPMKPPSWMRVIPLDRHVAKRIMEIYDSEFVFASGRAVVGIVGLEDKKFSLGGTYIRFNANQLNAIKLLMFNPTKIFGLWDILGYMSFLGDKEANFIEMVMKINRKCNIAHREHLIISEAETYRINPNVLKN